MAHHSSHRRILAAPNPQTPMDPTSRKPKSTTTLTTTAAATVNHRQPPPLIHPVPDPTVTTTIQNISHRFSKLYINHKKKNSFKPHPHPHPQPDPPSIQEKTSCTTLTKSSSQHERSVEKFHFLSTKVKVKGKDDFKKRDPKKMQSFEEFDVVKKISFSSKNEEIIVKGRNSLSSIPPALVNGGERRRSFCSSQVELADFFSVNSVKVVAVDMPPFMQFHAVDCARKAHDSLEKFTSKTLALTLKKEFDGVYGPAWHCIVGTSFGSFVTHSVGGFMYFSMDQKLYILLFKTTVQRAE